MIYLGIMIGGFVIKKRIISGTFWGVFGLTNKK